MILALDSVTKGEGHGAVDAVTATIESGSVTFILAETERRPTIVGLIASGRMRPASGTVTLDDVPSDWSNIRRRVALVDAPDACEPAPNVTVAGVTAEELMFAGLPSNRAAVRRLLAGIDLAEYAKDSISTVPPRHRVRLLTELATLRAEVDGLIIVSPDRHGGSPTEWWDTALDLAERGLAVAVVAGAASAAALGVSDSNKEREA
ncbi:hypothetical protein [Demequina aurantiaca]|uniref:hypothetical protein n=1 Tax=Demequina aurantiaca TaxID=676200 RepID=UPI000784FCA3|nr:hypothetical protein [Demequina aurantiaca]